MKNSSERGDTLIEVLVALTVLAVVVVGALSLMNKGVAQMYDSMERSEVRQLIEQQVELLNYARDQYLLSKDGSSTADATAVAMWQGIQGLSSVGATPGLSDCSAGSAFFIQGSVPTNFSLVFPATHAVATGFPAPGDGVWIQKISNNSSPVLYTDFFLRACWGQNSSAVTQVESSVVRLYDR